MTQDDYAADLTAAAARIAKAIKAGTTSANLTFRAGELEALAEAIARARSYPGLRKVLQRSTRDEEQVASARLEFERGGGAFTARAQRAIALLGWTRDGDTPRVGRRKKSAPILELEAFVRLTSVGGRVAAFDDLAILAKGANFGVLRRETVNPLTEAQALSKLTRFFGHSSPQTVHRILTSARAQVRRELKAAQTRVKSLSGPDLAECRRVIRRLQPLAAAKLSHSRGHD